MNEIYGASTEGNYPMGKNMRFVPNIADTHFPVTPMIRSMVKQLRSKQKAFQKAMQTTTNETISDLDYCLPTAGITL
jgi:hypothetical protein